MYVIVFFNTYKLTLQLERLYYFFGGIFMNYEKMTGAIDLEELEVQAEDVVEVSAGVLSQTVRMSMIEPRLCTLNPRPRFEC